MRAGDPRAGFSRAAIGGAGFGWTGGGAAGIADKPNILVIFGDDVGIANISAYSDGVMGYETPSIDRQGKEGLRFLHYYTEQSCTAGRAAFLTGQHGLRSGLTKVGFPGAPMGMSQLDPSIGGLLKNLGYATGQFGKNHVGVRNESLRTVHGFDEFFGNLYHLNAEEEPELPDYPKDPAHLAKFGPRGVLRCTATDKDDPTVDPRFGKIGRQTIEDTGALTKKRMETIDDETSAAAIDFMKRQHAGGKPFFCWMNTTRMHLRTHVRAEHRGRYTHGDSEYIDGMIVHDDTVGSLLKALDDMGIAGNTLVVYTSDNGPHMNTWPDGAMTYRLHIPAGVPAKDFWSVVLYDPQTRSELQTGQPFPSKNQKRDGLGMNSDGSVDLYFGPRAPEGRQANWTQTVPGKSWFALLRLDGPTEAWFDKSWRPGEVEEVK